MISPSHSSPVPPFHSLGNGTVEQTPDQRNSLWDMGGTFSLKALANKVLEQNKKWNKLGTAASNSVPPMLQSFSGCGTNAEVGCKGETDDFLYEFEERLAISEYGGHQTPLQAKRIAYQDAFITVLTTLPQGASENSPGGDWLDARITAAKNWLVSQGLQQPA